MGISVSESNATKEMDHRARTRRDGQKDQIRSELAAGPLESHQKNHSARKSKTEKGTPLRPILNALSDSRQIDPIWEERGSG